MPKGKVVDRHDARHPRGRGGDIEVRRVDKVRRFNGKTAEVRFIGEQERGVQKLVRDARGDHPHLRVLVLSLSKGLEPPGGERRADKPVVHQCVAVTVRAAEQGINERPGVLLDPGRLSGREEPDINGDVHM